MVLKKGSQLKPSPTPKNNPTNPHLQSEINALDEENMKLQRQIFKLKAEQFSLKNKIIILEEYTDKGCIHDTPPVKCLTERKQALKAKLAEYEKQKK